MRRGSPALSQSPLRPAGTERLTISHIPCTPFVVTEALSQVYYKGLPSQLHLIATAKPGPFQGPTGPKAYSVFKVLPEPPPC